MFLEVNEEAGWKEKGGSARRSPKALEPLSRSPGIPLLLLSRNSRSSALGNRQDGDGSARRSVSPETWRECFKQSQ